MKTINCFIPFSGKVQVTETIKGLRNCKYVKNIYLLSSEKSKEQIEGCEILDIPSLNASTTMKLLAAYSDADFTLLYTKHTTLELGYFATYGSHRRRQPSRYGICRFLPCNRR